jgi:glutaredoxin
MITIYTTPTCAFCQAEKTFFAGHKIDFKEVVVDSQQAAQELVDQSGQLGVPFTIIKKSDGSEEKILGFDQGRLRRVLGIS